MRSVRLHADTEALMMLEIECTACGAQLFVSRAHAEQAATCVHCGSATTVIGQHDSIPMSVLEQIAAQERAERMAQGRDRSTRPTCPFCGVELRRRVNQSQEHVLAKWIRRMPMYEGAVQSAKGGPPTWTMDAPTFVNGSLVYPRPRLHANKHPHVLATTVDVCQTCNNNWMSRLETDVERPLRPLIEGSSERVPAPEPWTLARWLGKVAIAYEADDLPTSHGTAEQVLDVRLGSPPRDAVMWAARWAVPDAPQLRHWVMSEVDMTAQTVSRRASQMLVAMGHVAFYMVYTDGQPIPPVLSPGEPWRLLWPYSSAVTLDGACLDVADFDAMTQLGRGHSTP